MLSQLPLRKLLFSIELKNQAQSVNHYISISQLLAIKPADTSMSSQVVDTAQVQKIHNQSMLNPFTISQMLKRIGTDSQLVSRMMLQIFPSQSMNPSTSKLITLLAYSTAQVLMVLSPLTNLLLRLSVMLLVNTLKLTSLTTQEKLVVLQDLTYVSVRTQFTPHIMLNTLTSSPVHQTPTSTSSIC